MRSQFLFLAVLLVLLLSATTPAAGQNTEFGAIDRFIEERMAALDIPGAALAIVQGGEIVYLEGYDVANPSGDPVTPQTPFSAGLVEQVDDGRRRPAAHRGGAGRTGCAYPTLSAVVHAGDADHGTSVAQPDEWA